jgi:hypothetical protein
MRGADLRLRTHGAAAKLGFKNAEWITAIEATGPRPIGASKRELVRPDLNVMSD